MIIVLGEQKVSPRTGRIFFGGPLQPCALVGGAAGNLPIGKQLPTRLTLPQREVSGNPKREL